MSLLNNRYATHDVLGTGTYGCVLRCTDTHTGRQVAVKIAQTDAPYRRCAINEINCLKLLSCSDETVHMLDFFEEDGHVCIVFELLSTSLHEVINFNKFRPLSLEAVRVCAERILRALVVLHQAGYMHCDIKPENVMLRPNKAEGNVYDSYARTCLIDFGAVRRLHENRYYDIQSLWYRAPEVILGIPYTPVIDSWSVGCLLFELYTGNALFQGDSAREQLVQIAHIVGMPHVEVVLSGANLAALQLPCVGVDVNAESQLRYLIAKYRFSAGCAQEFNDSTEEENVFLNLLCMLLHPDARMRVRCADALHHPFFTSFGWQSRNEKINGYPAQGAAGSKLRRLSSDDIMPTGYCAFRYCALSTGGGKGVGGGAEASVYNSLNCPAPRRQLPQMSSFQPLCLCPTCRKLSNRWDTKINDISFLKWQQPTLHFLHVMPHETICSAAPVRGTQRRSFHVQVAKQTLLQSTL